MIGAALLLMALLFSLALEQRAPEIGTLLALGFTPQQVRWLLLREGGALALLGGGIGALGGLAYAKAMLHGLTTLWRDAVGGAALNFHVTGQTLIIGWFASVVVAVVTIWLTLRKFVRRPAMQLLTGANGEDGELAPAYTEAAGTTRAAERGAVWRTSPPNRKSGDKSPHSKAAWAALLGALALVGWTLATSHRECRGILGAGALVLVAGLSFANAWLAGRAGVGLVSHQYSSPDGDRRDACPTLTSLAVRGCARRRKRSLATVAMLAGGSFLIVSIGVFRLDANRDATKRSSGTRRLRAPRRNDDAGDAGFKLQVGTGVFCAKREGAGGGELRAVPRPGRR